MAKVRLSEWKKKEVINCCDCKKLGYIEDLIIDECKGCIEALVVPEGGKWCNFFGDGTEYIIPFSCIKRIGPDLILVEIHEEQDSLLQKMSIKWNKEQNIVKTGEGRWQKFD